MTSRTTDLTFVVDSTQLDKAFKKAGQVETKIKQLAKAEASGSITTKQYADQVGKLASQLQKQVGGSIQARNSVNAYSRATLEAARANSEATKEMVKQEKALEALKNKYNPAYRGAQQFKNTLRELNEAHEKGAISSARHAEQVDRLKEEYRQFLNGTAGWSNQFVQGSNRAGKSLNKFGMVSQQFGYQMSDFLVQVQGGTNAFVAFGQQGAQLFGLISGPWGAALSIGAALVGAFGAAWMKSKEQMEEAATGAKALEDRIAGINSAVEEYFRNQRALQMGLTPEELDLSTSVEAAAKELKEAEEALRRAQAGGEGVGTFSRGGAQAQIIASEREQIAAAERVAEAERNLMRLQFKELAERTKEQEEFEREAAIEAIRAKEEAMQEYWQEYIENMNAVIAKERAEEEALQKLRFQGLMNQADAMTQETAEMEKQHLAAKALADQIFEARFDTEKLAALDLTVPLTSWADVALILATRMGDAAEAAQAMALATGQMPMQGPNTPPGWRPAKTTKTRSTSRTKETAEQFLARLQKEIDFKESLVGLSEEERDIATEVNRLKEQALAKDLNISEATLERYVVEERQADEALAKAKERERLEQQVQDSMADGIMAIVEGTKSIEDAFKDTIFNIVQEIYKSMVVDPLADAAGGFLQGLIGQANGGAWSNGVQMFAKGGVVNSPTMFGHSGGLGVMGEAGPEAIMPLKRGADGKLGVASQGSGGTTQVVVSLSPELVAQVLQQAESNSVRVVQKAAPGIVKASTSEMLNMRRKGGVAKATFG